MLSNVVSENHPNSFRRAISCFVLVMLAAFAFGCGMPGITSENTSNTETNANSNRTATTANNANNEPAAEPANETSTSRVTGACANEYYPVDPSIVKNFDVSGAESEDYSLTQKDVTEAGFKEERKFTNGTVVINNWTCEEDGLKGAEFTNQASFSKGNFEMETVKSTGVTIPRTMVEGKEWTSVYDVKVRMAAMKMNINADGKVNIQHKVAAVDEPVTVDGKEYKAARIDSRMKITVSVGGRTTETGDIKASNWYVKDVGMVKQSTSGTFGDTTVEYTGNAQ